MRTITKKAARVEMRRLFYLAFPLFLLTGCPNPAAYREPITRFQQASTVVIEGARIEYGLANKRERDAEIDRRVESKERIDLKVLNDPNIRVLSPDDLTARMAALDALAKHGELLLTLASSDAPARAKDAANSLDDAIVGLSSALEKTPSDDFKNAAQGFAAIAGEAANLALKAKIEQALDKAIAASENNVSTLIRTIRNDLRALYERRRAMASKARVDAVDGYNGALNQKSDSGSLKQAAMGIKMAEDDWDNLPLLLGAGPGLDAMADAHQKLVDYAKSPKTPQDLAGLVEATDAFVTRAKVIADAAKTIQEATEE
jgi:hypothetical protein